MESPPPTHGVLKARPRLNRPQGLTELRPLQDATEDLVSNAQDAMSRGVEVTCEFSGAETKLFSTGLRRRHRRILLHAPQAAAAVTVFEPTGSYAEQDTHIRLTASGACTVIARVY